MEAYGSAGFAAFLEEENSKKTVFFHSVHHEKNKDLRYHTFFFIEDENNKICTLLVTEHENQRDTVGIIDTDCCEYLDIEEEQIRYFFMKRGHVRDNITEHCKRVRIGRGYGHCQFHNHSTRANGGPYKIPGVNGMSLHLSEEKLYEKSCRVNNENAPKIVETLVKIYKGLSKTNKRR